MEAVKPMSEERLAELAPEKAGCCVVYAGKKPSPYVELYEEIVRLRAALEREKKISKAYRGGNDLLAKEILYWKAMIVETNG